MDIEEMEERYLVLDRIYQMYSFYKVILFFHKKSRPDFYSDKEEFQMARKVTLTLSLSYLYSIFDPSGIKFRKELFPDIEDSTLNDILDLWEQVEPPIRKIRHLVGFHGAPNAKSFDHISNSLNQLSGENQSKFHELVGKLKTLHHRLQNMPISELKRRFKTD